MKNKRLLTLEDLYSYYSSNSRSSHFNAKDDNDNIVVQVNGKIKFEEDDKNIEGLLPVTLHACHDYQNLNGSNIDKEVMEAALPSFSNRPILGYLHSVNGQDYFYDHRMHLDEEGELVYDESPVGIIPESCNAHLEYNAELGKDQVVVDGYIFEEYTKAADVLRREQECSVSVELSIRELQYNAKEKYLDIQDFFFSGVTILGVNPDGEPVKPGMAGSNIKLADFKQKNAEFSMVEMLEKIEDKIDLLSNLAINNATGKEETFVGDEKEIEVTEEVEETTSEEVTEVATEDEVTEVEKEVETEETSNEEPVAEEVPSTEEKYQKTFEISHEDIHYALYNLLSDFEVADNEWYFITNVYDDYFVYENWDGDKVFGQKYLRDGDNVSYDGERYNLHKELLSDAEYAELQAMRANYSALVEYKENAELEIARADKMSALSDYSSIEEKEEYKSLLENIDSYSKEELVEKADAIVGKYARQGMQFSIEEKKPAIKRVIGFAVNESKEPKASYSGLFTD